MAGLINLGNGLSQMGKSIAATAGAAALEAQREALEREKLQLADVLQGRRDASQHGYRMDEQKNAGDIQASNQKADADRRKADAIEMLPLETEADIKKSRARIAAENEQVVGVINDADGTIYQQKRGGGLINTNIKGPDKDDEQILNRAEKFGTVRATKDDGLGGKVSEEAIDPQKTADFLRRQGRDDLAARYAQDAPKGLPVPPAFAGQPDGTKLRKDGKTYVKRGSQLVPE